MPIEILQIFTGYAEGSNHRESIQYTLSPVRNDYCAATQHLRLHLTTSIPELGNVLLGLTLLLFGTLHVTLHA